MKTRKIILNDKSYKMKNHIHNPQQQKKWKCDPPEQFIKISWIFYSLYGRQYIHIIVKWISFLLSIFCGYLLHIIVKRISLYFQYFLDMWLPQKQFIIYLTLNTLFSFKVTHTHNWVLAVLTCGYMIIWTNS